MKCLKKFVWFVFMTAFLLAVSGGSSFAAGNVRVALLLSGPLGDKSFRDSAYEGLTRAVDEFGIEIKVLESEDPAGRESNLIAAASEKYDLVVGLGIEFQRIIANNAAGFPDVKFAMIDGVIEAPNVMSVVFAQNEGSFLAGAAAALFTTRTEIPGVNSEKIIGWVGGLDHPVLRDFLVSYEQGAAYIDPETKVLVSFAGTFNDRLKGKELALAQYRQGADIVMNAAGITGIGVLEAAYESKLYAIGVDLDQDGLHPGHILTSVLKRVDMGTYLITKAVAEGNFEGGRTIAMDISNGGVGLTNMEVMRNALGDKFPQDILDRINALEEEVKSGRIEVASYEGLR